MSTIPWIEARWPAKTGVMAGVSTREGGFSDGVYASLNLAHHVGDDPETVRRNRGALRAQLQLPSEPLWLNQCHSADVVNAEHQPGEVNADAACSRCPGTVLAVMTADCLPVLLAATDAPVIAAVHAGWRGLAQGIIANAVRAVDHDPARLMAWLGPAIGPEAYEIGREVRAAFSGRSDAFRAANADRWYADLYALARAQLREAGVTATYGGNFCTYREDRFYSYRRDGQTGRMASLIWIPA